MQKLVPKSWENLIVINEISNYNAFSTTEFEVFITSSIMKFIAAPLMHVKHIVKVQIPLVRAPFFRLGKTHSKGANT